MTNIPPAGSAVSGSGIVTPRTARFLRELEGPHASPDRSVDYVWRSDPDDDIQVRAFPELVAAIALVGVILVVLAAGQIGALTTG